MRMPNGLAAILFFAFSTAVGHADGRILPSELDKVNRTLHGRIVDFTNNHNKDRRFWSQALCQKRAMYVYLPPCYDPNKKYPLAIFLHGAGQDEQIFLSNLAGYFDTAIASGRMAPMIVAAPDGSEKNRPSLLKLATFWANTDAGRFEDYLMEDVWNFLMREFSIRPEREAHALFGASAGGAGAFTNAIKHKDKVKIAMGFMPALNLRWVDCHGKYMRPFDPECWGWREKVHRFDIVGRPLSLIKLRYHNLLGTLVGYGPDAVDKIKSFNPIEIMEQYDLRPGELDLWVGYGGKDEFNMTAQVDSFLFVARERKIDVGVEYDPYGRHDEKSARKLFPSVIQWFAPLVERYREPQ